MEELLSDPTQCRVFGPNLAVHWYPSFRDGVTCYCGATTRKDDADNDDTDARRDQAAPSDNVFV